MPCILTGAGLLFCPDAIQPDTSVYSVFCRVNAKLYSPRHKTAHRALQRLFMRLHPFNRPQYQTDKSGYNTTRATLEGIHAPQCLQCIPDTTATPGRLTGQHRPPIIIMYIRVHGVRPAVDPCQTVQHIADHASPAGSRCFHAKLKPRNRVSLAYVRYYAFFLAWAARNH